MMASRLESVFTHLATAMRLLRETSDVADLSSGTSDILRARLGPKERSFLLAVAVKAASPVDTIYLHDILGQILADSDELDELSAEAQMKRWTDYCANRTEYEKRRA